MMDKDTVARVAELARIRLTDVETPEVTRRLDAILSMVDALQAVETDTVEPLAHPLEATQRLRPDTVTEADQRDRLLPLAPASENGLFLVPRVIE